MINIDPTDKAQPSAGLQKAGGLDPKKKAKLEKAVQEFESVFVGYMLKTMRATIQKSDMADEGFGGDMLEGMFDMEMARHISQSKGLGVAEMLYKQMTGESLPSPSSRGTQTTATPLAGFSETTKVHGARTRPETLGRRLEHLDEVIQEAAGQHSLDANLLKAVIATESGGKADSVSTKGAKGLMQLIDSTASDMGVSDVWNPRENVLGGAKYLKAMLDRFDGDLSLALASYNAGPGAVEKHKGIPPYKETKDYVNKVLDFFHHFSNEDKGE